MARPDIVRRRLDIEPRDSRSMSRIPLANERHFHAGQGPIASTPAHSGGPIPAPCSGAAPPQPPWCFFFGTPEVAPVGKVKARSNGQSRIPAQSRRSRAFGRAIEVPDDTPTMASHRSRMVGLAQEDAFRFFRVQPPARRAWANAGRRPRPDQFSPLGASNFGPVNRSLSG